MPAALPWVLRLPTDHVGEGIELRQLSDYRGDRLVDEFLKLIEHVRPMHVSIVGGDPLVRYRELNQLLPELQRRGIEVQLVTSAVRPIPTGQNLQSGSVHRWFAA